MRGFTVMLRLLLPGEGWSITVGRAVETTVDEQNPTFVGLKRREEQNWMIVYSFD